MLSNFSYVRARSIKDAVNHLSKEGSRLHAGGTDLLGCLREGIFGAEKVVSISALRALRGIRQETDGGVRIGALTTITEVAESPLIKNLFPGLSQAAGEVASPQLRNQGTLGGNICQKPRCWYYRGEFHCLRKGGERCFAVGGENQFHCIFGGELCTIVHPSDTAPALVALGASARVVGLRGTRKVALEKFHVLPEQDPTRETVLARDEIVTEIVVPPPPPGLRTSYRKVRARRSWDFALAGTALALRFDGPTVKEARVVLSGVAPVPWRSREVEEVLNGKNLDENTVARAAGAGVQGARAMEKNAYKIPLLRGVLTEELRAMGRG